MMDKMIFEKATTIAKGNLDYHKRQIITPYRSTVKMTEWLNEKGVFKNNTKILDMACGGGGKFNLSCREVSGCLF